METEPPPPNPPPHGFNFVNSPNMVSTFRSPLFRESEMNPNTYNYFCYCDVHGKVFLDHHLLRNICRNLINWPSWLKRPLMQHFDGGVVRPAHLPSMNDLFGWPEVAKVVFNWEFEKLDEADMMCTNDHETPVIPTSWLSVIDPKPQIRNYGRIFLLRERPCTVAHGNYTDGVDVFHVMAPMSHIRLVINIGTILPRSRVRLNCVKISPGIREGATLISPHTCVLVWTIRGVSRPSFIDNFKQITETHKPDLIVLLETRSPSDELFEFVYYDLKTDYWFYCLESNGFDGGAIVMWRTPPVEVDCKTVMHKGKPVLVAYAKASNVASNSSARRILFN